MSDFEEKHPRDERGRFGAGLGAFADKQVGKTSNLAALGKRYAPHMMNEAIKGGFTFKPGVSKVDRAPKDGYMVSRPVSEGLGHVIELKQKLDGVNPPTRDAMRQEVVSSVRVWLDKALPALEKLGPDHYLGGYLEKDHTGAAVALHFDVSQHVKDKSQALEHGKSRNQVSIWDVANFDEIKTGGTGR
jgi:hypothetical protein